MEIYKLVIKWYLETLQQFYSKWLQRMTRSQRDKTPCTRVTKVTTMVDPNSGKLWDVNHCFPLCH